MSSTSMDIHDVVRIDAEDSIRLNCGTWVTTITLHNEDGSTTSVTAYSERPLQVEKDQSFYQRSA